MAQAFEGLSMGMTIELLQKASGYYAGWGAEERSVLCNRLAEFYAARQRGAGDSGERERESESLRERRDAGGLEGVLQSIEAAMESLEQARRRIEAYDARSRSGGSDRVRRR